MIYINVQNGLETKPKLLYQTINLKTALLLNFERLFTKMKKQFLFTLGLCLSLFTYGQTVENEQQVVEGRQNSAEQQQKPYVIMISVDGFRYNYAEKYHAQNLLALSKSGVKAKTMVPSYPSITFPNHYTMVTGLYPSHSGLVSNRFYDRNFKQTYSYKGKTTTEGKWYGGTPLWVLAEQQQMLTASFYWVGSEADIKSTYPTYFYRYSEKIGIHERIQTVVNWLKLPVEKRPHLITFYFPEVDHAGHSYGPDAPETRKQVLFIDSAIKELNKAVKTTGLPVNFILVSDHGMTPVDTQHPLRLPAAAADSTKFTIAFEDILVGLYAKDSTTIQSTYQTLKSQAKGYDVYLRNKTPKHWHYDAANDRFNRIGDILLVPRWPQVFAAANRKPNPGAHGFDPKKVSDMKAIFYAWGPAFEEHKTIKPFKNINLYPMVTQLLGLQITEPVDGDDTLAKKVLKK